MSYVCICEIGSNGSIIYNNSFLQSCTRSSIGTYDLIFKVGTDNYPQLTKIGLGSIVINSRSGLNLQVQTYNSSFALADSGFILTAYLK